MNRFRSPNSASKYPHTLFPDKFIPIFFIAVILLQIATLLFFGFQKKDYHIDEIYTYILSNSCSLPDIAESDEIWNTRSNSRLLTELLTVQADEQFSYDHVYYNNSLDANPPLFYFLLHTICSLFPNIFSKWLGLSLNIAIFVLTQSVLFSLSRKIFGQTMWAVAPCALYGGTRIALDTFLFIRMYSLLTFFVVLLLYFHYLMLSRERRWDYLCCFAITFAGVFTQYYFAITAFYIAAAFCIYLLLRKEWTRLTLYAISMLAAILCVFLVYPAVITQITGSSTNNVGNAIWGHILDFSSLLHSSLYMGKLLLIGMGAGLWKCKEIAIVLIVVFVALAILLRKKLHSSNRPNREQSVALLAVSSSIFVLILLTVSHISNDFLYDRYLYNIVPFFSLIIVYAAKLIADHLPVNQRILAFGVVCIWLLSSISLVYHRDNNYLYQSESKTNTAVIELCNDKPLVVVCSSSYDVHMLAGNFTILANCDPIYVVDSADYEKVDTLLSSVDCGNGVVFMVITDQYWTNGFNGDEVMTDYVAASNFLSKYEEYALCNFGVICLAE